MGHPAENFVVLVSDAIAPFKRPGLAPSRHYELIPEIGDSGILFLDLGRHQFELEVDLDDKIASFELT